MEHETCKDCKWNNYPECTGTIIEDGTFMNIEDLNVGFLCGVKDRLTIKDFSITTKTKLEDLEARILALEDK